MIVACPVECVGMTAPVGHVGTAVITFIKEYILIGSWGHVNTISSVEYVRMMMGCEIVQDEEKESNTEKYSPVASIILLFGILLRVVEGCMIPCLRLEVEYQLSGIIIQGCLFFDDIIHFRQDLAVSCIKHDKVGRHWLFKLNNHIEAAGCYTLRVRVMKLHDVVLSGGHQLTIFANLEPRTADRLPSRWT